MGKKLIEPILITGCARSGTSLVAGAINKCGAFGGDMSGPNKNNKKGMFENHKIRQDIVKPYLRDSNLDPMGQFPLPDVHNIMIPTDWRRRVEQVMLDQGYKGGPWMYKGAKSCLMWPVWHYAFPRAKWIIVRRRTGDIVDSCMRTGFMRAFNNASNRAAVGAKDEREGWLWWVHQHEERFIEMTQHEEGPNCKVIWPHRMVRGDFEQLYDVIEWLGLKWNSEIPSFIDQDLWHSRLKEKEEA